MGYSCVFTCSCPRLPSQTNLHMCAVCRNFSVVFSVPRSEDRCPPPPRSPGDDRNRCHSHAEGCGWGGWTLPETCQSPPAIDIANRRVCCGEWVSGGVGMPDHPSPYYLAVVMAVAILLIITIFGTMWSFFLH